MNNVSEVLAIVAMSSFCLAPILITLQVYLDFKLIDSLKVNRPEVWKKLGSPAPLSLGRGFSEGNSIFMFMIGRNSEDLDDRLEKIRRRSGALALAVIACIFILFISIGLAAYIR